jgi:hypothetical protein
MRGQKRKQQGHDQPDRNRPDAFVLHFSGSLLQR